MSYLSQYAHMQMWVNLFAILIAYRSVSRLLGLQWLLVQRQLPADFCLRSRIDMSTSPSRC